MLDGMTNIKASEVLKEIKYYTEDLPPYSPDEVAEALEMAIQALEAQPCEEDFVKHKKEVLERIAKREREIDKYIKELETLKQQPSEDCISREEVQDLISRWLSDYLLDETREALETINYKVGDMPSVKPERPKGKWKRIAGFEDCNYDKCSVCGVYQLFYYGKPSTNYCPNCGAEMGGADETN